MYEECIKTPFKVNYINQIALHFRKELVCKHLIAEEIYKPVNYNTNDKIICMNDYFVDNDSVPDLNWEIQISLWASQVYLNAAELENIFSMLEIEMVQENPQNDDSVLI